MSTPKLRKLALTVTKDASGSDTRQVPASGVTLSVYKRGATSDRTQSVTDSTSGVSVWTRDARDIAVGDVLQKGTAATPSITVTAKPNNFQLTVDSDGNGTMSLVSGDRLVIKGPGGRIPTLYSEASGAATTSSPTTDSAGYAECYVKERFVDVIVSGTGISTRLLANEATGDDEVWVNARNYSSIQAAIDAVGLTLGNAAGTVYIPAGEYEVASTINVDKAVRIVGDGPAATILYFDSGKNTDVFNITNSFVTIEHLGIGFVGTAGSGTGRGIVVGDTSPIGSVTFRNIQIYDPPSWGIQFLAGESGNAYVSHTLFEKVNIYRPRSGGCVYLGSDTFVTKFHSCVLDMNHASAVGYAIHAKNPTNLVIDTCEVAPATNTVGIFLESDASGTGQGSPLGVIISGCDIETGGGSTAYAIHIKDGKNVVIMNNYVYQFDNGAHLEDCLEPVTIGNLWRAITTTHITLTDTTDAVIVNDRGAGSGTTETTALLVVAEAGTTAGTMILANGVIQPPRYATGSLPAGGATTRRAGSLAYDTSTNTLKVLRNDLTTWANVP